MNAWVVTDGKIGTEKQCLALAEALGLDVSVKRIAARFPWTHLPPSLWFNPINALTSDSKTILMGEPWPAVIIAASRVAAAPVAQIKKILGAKIKIIFLQNPYLDLSCFDVVIAPKHDGLKGKNLIETMGALHNVTPERLVKEKEKWAKILPKTMPRPWVSILLGGNSRHHKMDPDTMEYYGSRLRHLAQRSEMSFLVTPSRRTPRESLTAFRRALGDCHHFIWNELGDNPYYGFLALGDIIIVTNDSVSMLSEAASLGKPLYTFSLRGGRRRLNLFNNYLEDAGIVRPFNGFFDEWDPKPVNDMAHVVKELRKKIKISTEKKVSS